MTSHEDGQLPERVRELARSLVDERDLEVIDVALSGPGGRPLVRVVVDTADPHSTAGVDVDDIAKLSRRLGEVLDERDLFEGSYTLEVTSPGADRPLTTHRDFARNLGRDVRIERDVGDRQQASDTAGCQEIAGTLVEVDDDHVTLDIEGTEQRIPFAAIVRGKVVLPW